MSTMQYRIISVSAVFSEKSAIEKLVGLVNEAIAQGWEPIGGVCQGGTSLHQAVIKRG